MLTLIKEYRSEEGTSSQRFIMKSQVVVQEDNRKRGRKKER